jgi:LPXTG-site transpeptidase (sortase) family protein
MEPRPDDQGSLRREPRRNWRRLFGDLLLVAGAVSMFLAGFAYFTDPSRADMSLPRPVALANATGEPTAVPTVGLAGAPPIATAMPTSPAATATPKTAPTPTATPVKTGVPVRIFIPSIGVDSKVQDIGTARVDGQLIWETIPYIVGHYRTSAQAGQNGNAVFAGHVTSQTLGNVFIDLYKVNLGDEVQVYSQDAVFTYTVSKVRLVLPTDTAVMDPTTDATATLITCGGDWIPAQHQYSRRLIVTAKLQSVKPIR